MYKKNWIKWFFLGLAVTFFLASMIWLFVDDIKHSLSLKPTHIVQIVFLIISFLALITISFFISVSKVITKNKELKRRLDTWKNISYHISEVNDEVVTDLPVGIILVSDDDLIEWANQEAQANFGSNIIGTPIKKLTPDFEEAFRKEKENFVISSGEQKFEVQIRSKTNAYFFFNVTKREEIKKLYYDRQVVVAIISLDNFDDIVQQLDISVQSNIKGQYLSAIADWGLKYGGFIKTFGSDKMILTTYRTNLDEMIKDKFDILETIRSISQKNNVLVTVSIGIASWNIPLMDVANYAQNAVELAEKRGGDQVVVNIENQEITYFGAKTDQESSSSKVGARQKAQNLRKVVSSYQSVYIMGHINADTDAYASMYGLTKLLLSEGFDNTFMVVDFEKLDQTVQKIHQVVIQEDPLIINHQLTSKQVLDSASNNSLLIIVDTQSQKIVMSQEVFAKIPTRAVIDHHRATDDSFTGVFEYLEPTASSTCELLVELMDFFTSKNNRIAPFTATVLYSGILVDTNNFAHRTGARTFEAASRLKECGADTNEVRKWLRRDMNRLFQINDLISRAELVFDNKIAITQTDEIIPDPVLPAQVSDELLQIDGVEASFSVVPISDNQIAVSARSLGSFNVQVVMESMHGGGHFSAAATKLTGKTVSEVVTELKDILNVEFQEEGKLMKILLLEDLVNKGKKNDIVEVPFGYGNFLIKNGVAVEATEQVISERNAQLKQEAEAKQVRTEMLKKLASEIETKTIDIKVQVGRDGKLFGKVTTQEIADEFQKQTRIVIDRKKIKLPIEINSIGIYTVIVDLGLGIDAKFSINVAEL